MTVRTTLSFKQKCGRVFCNKNSKVPWGCQNNLLYKKKLCYGNYHDTLLPSHASTSPIFSAYHYTLQTSCLNFVSFLLFHFLFFIFLSSSLSLSPFMSHTPSFITLSFTIYVSHSLFYQKDFLFFLCLLTLLIFFPGLIVI